MNTHRPVKDPGGLAQLQSRISKTARDRALSPARVQVTIAQVVVAQMLPRGAVKGGAAMKLRRGTTFSRDSRDLDTALGDEVEDFVHDLSTALDEGWGGFTGRLVPMRPATPDGVPPSYVMRPFEVKLAFRGKSFTTLDLEVGHDELGAPGEPLEAQLADDIATLFAELGLLTPRPVHLLPVALQIAQKLHACSAPGSERAHDLVDLQLLAPSADPLDVATAARRVFAIRQLHPFPPVIASGEGWPGRYDDAAVGLPVRDAVEDAVDWANRYIEDLVSCWERHCEDGPPQV